MGLGLGLGGGDDPIALARPSLCAKYNLTPIYPSFLCVCVFWGGGGMTQKSRWMKEEQVVDDTTVIVAHLGSASGASS